jgi:predicted lipoprotein with Yx(FWY)xxD motif
MQLRSTRLTAVRARPRAFPSTHHTATRKARTPRLIAAALTTIAVAAIPLLAGATSGASAAGSANTVIGKGPGPFGPMLVVGSGPLAGLTVYFITSDQPPRYGCTTAVFHLGRGSGESCTGPVSDQNAEWPALTTTGQPVAGAGVSQKLLGTVHRAGIGTQITYAGHPLYLFDQSPGQVSGEGWFEPSLPPDHGLWYVVSPRGVARPWAGMLSTLPIGGKRVLGAPLFDGGGWHVFPVYSYSADSATKSTCQGACAAAWPPLLTAGSPGVEGSAQSGAVGTLTRPDGTLQVTYHGKPLYLFSNEGIAKDPNDGNYHPTGTGNGIKVAGGTFDLVTP